MFMAIIFLWLGCLIAFLGSEQQKLITTNLNKSLSLSAFAVFVFTSWLLFSDAHSGVITALLIMSFMMVMWLIIIFVQGHLSIKLLPFTFIGCVISASLVQLGGL